MGHHEQAGYPHPDVGQAKLVHVVASTAPILSKPFFPQVKRCEEALQKIDSL